MFTLRCKQAVTGDQLSPVSLLPAINTGDNRKMFVKFVNGLIWILRVQLKKPDVENLVSAFL